MGFKVDSKGFDDFIDKMSVNSENLENNVMKTVKQIAQEIADDAKDLAPVDTGHLRENIFSRVVQDGNTIVGEIFSNIEYAAYVEFGTGIVGQSAGLTREWIICIIDKHRGDIKMRKEIGITLKVKSHNLFYIRL